MCGSETKSSSPESPSSPADARLPRIFHRFMSGLAWIHNLYLKACSPPGPAPPSRGRPKARAMTSLSLRLSPGPAANHGDSDSDGPVPPAGTGKLSYSCAPQLQVALEVSDS